MWLTKENYFFEGDTEADLEKTMPPICEGQPAEGKVVRLSSQKKKQSLQASQGASITCVQTVHKTLHYNCCIQPEPINDQERGEGVATV